MTELITLFIFILLVGGWIGLCKLNQFREDMWDGDPEYWINERNKRNKKK